MCDHEDAHHGIDDPMHPHNAPLTDVQLRVRALESLLLEKGLVDPAALDELVDAYEARVGPRNGAQLVARAWTDPEFKEDYSRMPLPRWRTRDSSARLSSGWRNPEHYLATHGADADR
jgi:nitrile hydratase